jgi:hypothetical protein
MAVPALASWTRQALATPLLGTEHASSCGAHRPMHETADSYNVKRFSSLCAGRVGVSKPLITLTLYDRGMQQEGREPGRHTEELQISIEGTHRQPAHQRRAVCRKGPKHSLPLAGAVSRRTPDSQAADALSRYGCDGHPAEPDRQDDAPGADQTPRAASGTTRSYRAPRDDACPSSVPGNPGATPRP